ncbi:DVU_1553 family AMP-dependent CoA ligase [Desulfomonile tiedjei]|uniref:Coenzyme F390 synthetase n=1 Tax=Desulfomonile tiedjei (strain ATCC 49306 / DSM 6799 / DCB-1) TaxID=706587 RepID=I4C4L0_DESTA|nr:phenylacetate--CoA ligase family protein [Desulfomonile tiedjei]AFM24501.1 coenzyme F390 synthetase [Desulfomonile tiedjei DSM 6799]
MQKTPLENWIAYRMGLSTGNFTESDMREYQLERLRETIEYVAEKSPFYRGLLRGFSATDLRTLDDLEQFPFTTPQDIRDKGPQFPCVSQSEIERVVTLMVPDAAEQPRRLHFTRQDLELTVDFFHHGMSALVETGQKVLILLPGPRPDSVGNLLARGLSRMGVKGIVHGLVEDPLKAVHAILQSEIEFLVGLPGQVLSIAKHHAAKDIPSAQMKGLLVAPDACLRSPYVPDAIIEELQRTWDCPVFCHYGTTEMGFGGGVECRACSGYHVREADLYFEIIDPNSARTVPQGELGEITFTTLTRRGMPLVRYRTGHFGRFLKEPCPCGTVLPRMERMHACPDYKLSRNGTHDTAR